MRKHRVGVVGLRQATAFINIFDSYPDTQVTAICDIDEPLLNAVGDRYGIEQRFTDYEAFVQTDIDIVELSTPIQVHGEQAIAAMKNGKHVLCQYIAANDPDEAHELLRVAKASEKQYRFIETDCYERKNRIMVELAKRGVLGELTWGRGEYLHDCKTLGYKPDGSHTWRGELWKKSLGGIAAGVHTCMPLLCAFDERVETLYAMGPGPRTLPEFNWNDTVIALCKFPSGRMIQLQTDIFSYRPVRCGYFLQGTKGCFEYDRATVVSDGGSREGEAPAEPPSLSGWKSLDELQEAYQLTDTQADYPGHGSAFVGLGRRRGRYTLESVLSVHPTTGETAPIYTEGGRVLDWEGSVTYNDVYPAVEQLQKQLSGNGIRVEFITPTRLISDGQPADSLHFSILVRSLLRRISGLCYFHCNQRWDADFAALVKGAEGVTSQPINLHWADWKRYSSLQEKRVPMGGVLGCIEYCGDIEVFLPYLLLGTWLHVGKATTFGNGRYLLHAPQG